MKHEIRYFQILPSTNLYIEENLRSLNHGDVVVASKQTNGRGRLGREWESSSGALTFSMLYKDGEIDPCLLPLLSSVAVAKTMESLGLSPLLKWPNDVMLLDKKCCGILVQGVSQGEKNTYIIGIGVNLNQKSFPDSLPNATSLFVTLGKSVDKQSFLNAFLENFDSLSTEEALGFLKDHDYLLGKKIDLSYYGEGLSGLAKGIDSKGNLLLENEQGDILTISSGEATLHREK